MSSKQSKRVLTPLLVLLDLAEGLCPHVVSMVSWVGGARVLGVWGQLVGLRNRCPASLDAVKLRRAPKRRLMLRLEPENALNPKP